MRKTFTLLFVALLISAIKSNAQDASLSGLALSSYIKTNTDYSITVDLINNSSTDITQVAIGWQLDNEPANVSAAYTITGGLPSGGYYVRLPLSPDLNTSTEGKHTFKVWADASGEQDRSNDTITFSFTALSTYASKVTLLEEGTAQWCEHCPPAGKTTDSLASLPDVAVARFHDTDGFSFTSEEQYFDRYFNGPNAFFPAAEVEMSELGNYVVNTNYPNWRSDVLAQSGISPLMLTMNSSVNASTRVLTVTLTGNFKYAEAGTYRFNAFILENGIIGDQTQPNLTVIHNFVHNYVVRYLLGGVTGSGGVIPANPVVNTDYVKTYTYTIPSGWNINNLNIVGTVFKIVNGQTGTVNAVKSSINTGVNNIAVENNINAYPNPFVNGITLNIPGNNKEVAVSIFSVDGKMLFQRTYAAVNSGSLYVDLTEKNLAPGFYTLTVKTENNIYSGKLIKD